PVRLAARQKRPRLGHRRRRGNVTEGEPADLVDQLLREPEGVVWTGHDALGSAAAGGDGEFGDAAGCRDAADLAGTILGEPEGAVRTHGDADWGAACGRNGERVGE